MVGSAYRGNRVHRAKFLAINRRRGERGILTPRWFDRPTANPVVRSGT